MADYAAGTRGGALVRLRVLRLYFLPGRSIRESTHSRVATLHRAAGEASLLRERVMTFRPSP